MKKAILYGHLIKALLTVAIVYLMWQGASGYITSVYNNGYSDGSSDGYAAGCRTASSTLGTLIEAGYITLNDRKTLPYYPFTCDAVYRSGNTITLITGRSYISIDHD